MGVFTVRYLREEEKTRSRALWEEAFPEDSREFDDFYFADKIKGNRLIVKEEDGEIISMAHLNPYRVAAGEKIWDSYYIVGVATAASKRHRGHMRDILDTALGDMYRDGVEFCFLMPADERIYLPFGFTYIFDQPRWELKGTENMDEIPFDRELHGELVRSWMDEWLTGRFDVYCVRDGAYWDMFERELASENGSFHLFFREGGLIGMECVWGLGKRERRALYADGAYLDEAAAPKPAIMARIVNLQRFIGAVALNQDAPVEELKIHLQVTDPLIKGNDGEWLWRVSREGSTLVPHNTLAPAKSVATCRLSATISELTGWLFGYRPVNAPEWSRCIRTLRKVFLDEVV